MGRSGITKVQDNAWYYGFPFRGDLSTDPTSSTWKAERVEQKEGEAGGEESSESWSKEGRGRERDSPTHREQSLVIHILKNHPSHKSSKTLFPLPIPPREQPNPNPLTSPSPSPPPSPPSPSSPSPS